MNISTLLEYKQLIQSYYIRYETAIRHVMRFVLAFTCLALINGRMGFYTKLAHFIVTLALSLLCAVLPTGFTAFFCAILSLAHLYALSFESCAMGLVLYLCIYLLYYRFSPHDAYVLLLTPVLFAFHVPCIVPFVTGLLLPPVSVVSMCFGVVVWFFLHAVVQSTDPSGNIRAENVQEQAEETIGRIQGIVGSLSGDKTMIVYVIAFAVTAVLIYIIRRQAIRNAWLIAIGTGAFVNVVILLAGGVSMDANVGIAGAFLGTLLGAAIAVVILFFSFNPDYHRMEQVQFEDEDNYYYVKVIPKLAVRERSFRSKSINRALHTSESEAAGEKPDIEYMETRHRTQHHATHQKHAAAKGKTAGRKR